MPARRQTAVRGLPLYLFAGGLALLTAGDAIYAFYQAVLRVEDPFPSPADAFYLANSPFFVAALVLLVSHSGARLGGYYGRGDNIYGGECALVGLR